MQKTYSYPRFPYRQSDEQRTGQLARHAVVVIGAGPIGLTMALDLAARGLQVVVLDDNDTVSIGSRAVCYAKRPLEVWDRLGVAAPMVEKGVRWKVGKVFFRDDPVYRFDLLPEPGHQMPAMINLQQYHLEETLVAACDRNARVDLRWKHRLVSLQQDDTGAQLTIETPDGVFRMQADWVIACDGANSDTRRMVGAEFTGQFFQDRFLIADVVMNTSFPSTDEPPAAAHRDHPPRGAGSGLRRLGAEPERWFWFDPPFHTNPSGAPTSVLLHKQADDVWRIDFQLGWDADPEEEKKPEKVIPRIRAMLGDQADFELEWVSVYQFACRRIKDFRVGRVLFAGDAAHQVSPFGARGANTGVQDVDNLAWKLALVQAGQAPVALLDSYHAERAFAADDNLLNSTRSTDFITPKSRGSRSYRNAVLELAESEPFARPLVNSGRLSTPTPYAQSPLNTPDTDAFEGRMNPGTVCDDAPVLRAGQHDWLLRALGDGFAVLHFAAGTPATEDGIAVGDLRARVLNVGTDLVDADGTLAERYDARPGTTYLIRPDQHVAARWRGFDTTRITAAMRRALAM